MIWNENHQNALVTIVLIMLLAVTSCIANDAMAATEQPDGSWVLTEQEKLVCANGCKLLSTYQINVLEQYIEQLREEVKKLEREQEARKLKVCI